MPNPLDLPDELLPLIEKRDQDDRRDSKDAAPSRPTGAPRGPEERRQGGRRADDRRED